MAEDINIKPQAGGQTRFLSKIFVDEVLFGGAAGPGKSWALVYDALGTQYRHTELGKAAYEISDYRAALFRRKTTQFSKLLDEGKKMYIPLGAELIYGRRGDPGPSFNFPSGARIFVCHMEQEDNKEDHQGIEYQYCGFDELTQFTVTQYTYLFSRLRSTIPGLNTRMRATTNPTGSGLMWVKKRFVKTNEQLFMENKVHYFIPDYENAIEDNPTGILSTKENELSKSRMFIPGRLSENKILEESDPGYKLGIMAMGKKYENALLHGDWDAFGGDFFDDFDSKVHVIEPFEIPKEWKLGGAVDPGWSNACAYGHFAIDLDNNVYCVFATSQRGKSPTQNAEYVKSRIENFKYTHGLFPKYIVSGLDAWAKKDRHAIISSDATFADKWYEVDKRLYLEKANNERVNGWMTVKEYMRFNRIYFFRGYTESLIDEIVAAPTGEKDPDDIEGKGNDPDISDHSIDMLRYFLNSREMNRRIAERDDMPDFWQEKLARERRQRLKKQGSSGLTIMSG